MSEIYQDLREAIRAGRSVATATIIRAESGVGSKLLIGLDGSIRGSFGSPELDTRAAADAQPLMIAGESRVFSYTDLGVALFIESFVPPPTLFMVGGVHIAIGLAAMAKVVGFHTVVIDARSSFANEERFFHADELILAWPDEALEGRLDARSCVAVLTHDPKLDDPALRVALRSSARYIGALGSPTTHTKRLARLSEQGFSAEELARIHAPIGLPLGAKTPEEIALSVLAEIVKVQRGR